MSAPRSAELAGGRTRPMCGLEPKARLLRVALGRGEDPLEVLRRAKDDGRPFGLVGNWASGSALIGSEPVAIASGSEESLAALDALPSVEGARPGAVGGGWVGYLGYRLGARFENVPEPRTRPVPMEVAALGFYDHLVRLDRTSGVWWFEALWTNARDAALAARLELWRSRVTGPGPRRDGDAPAGPVVCSVPGDPEHVAAVAQAIEYIRAGEVFQVNVCRRLQAPFTGDPVSLFVRGAGTLRPRYGAFVSGPDGSIASFSPELFLRRTGEAVVSSPIKGTMRRRDGDMSTRELLASSEKDRAENLMIVDLMRNDLGRVARYGTVEVPALFRVEAHPGVWHLVSDVSALLRPGVANSDLIRATFPPGSVTGAPKVRAMELIASLEATGREAYTGAVGIASPLSGLELNVAIRTVEMAADQLWLGVGGGIVADSEPEAELRECETKAAPILRALFPPS